MSSERGIVLNKRIRITFEDFPRQWVPFQLFFDPEILGFPLVRVHFKEKGHRVVGIPLSHSVGEESSEGGCCFTVDVVSNIDLDKDERLQEKFKEDLSERFGLSKAQNRKSLKECFRSENEYMEKVYRKWRKTIDLIFPRLAKYYGKIIPCGQFYPELYGVVRFVASWNPPGGRKQEYIMLSNVLQTIGRRVPVEGRDGISFHLLPTYREAMSGSLHGFDEFKKMKKAVMEYGSEHLTREYKTENHVLHLLDESKGSPNNHERWRILIDDVGEETKRLLTQLKEDFNRNYLRPFIFITFFYNIFKGVDFSSFTKEEYIQIYEDQPRGFYPKVLAVTLQQAFRKYDIIPVDTWVKTFFEETLDIPVDWSIPESGKNLGKFERFLWYSGQLRKNNRPVFTDILHCTKTGVLHSKTIRIRTPNPLSCSLCSIQEECPTYNGISEKKVLVVSENRLKDKDSRPSRVLLKRPKLRIDKKLEMYFDSSIASSELSELDFVLLVNQKGEPEEVYLPRRTDGRSWNLHDNMSSFQVSGRVRPGTYRVSEVVNKIHN